MKNFKFVLKLDLDKYNKICYNHGWFNKIDKDYYDYFSKLYLPKNITENSINEFAKIIKDLSVTNETIIDIRQTLENIIRLSEQEV